MSEEQFRAKQEQNRLDEAIRFKTQFLAYLNEDAAFAQKVLQIIGTHYLANKYRLNQPAP